MRPASVRVAARSRGAWTRIAPTSETHAVTTLELFFDLVFVFAITRVTAFMADDLSWRGLVRGLLLLALLWWAWSSYAWLGNQARADIGLVRSSMVLAMAAMFLVALAIPEAWADPGRGLVPPPLLLATALAVVRLGHLAVYAIAASGDPGLRGQLVRTSVPVVAAALLLVGGALAGGPAQTGLWAVALIVDYVGVYAAGADWRLPAPAHFAERYGLIVIIALGESLIAVGVGVAGLPLRPAVLVVALLGLTVSVAMWRMYFAADAPAAEEALRHRLGPDRVRMARDAYTYLHFPMVAGVIYLALGLKKVAEYVADTTHHSLADPVPAGAGWALSGGVALYVAAVLAFRRRSLGTFDTPRAVLVLALVAVPPVAGRLPAVALLAVVSVAVVAFLALEPSRPTARPIETP